MTIKDQKDSKHFSTSYSDNFIHLCDSTYILFDGLIPMTQKIPLEGYYQSLEK